MYAGVKHFDRAWSKMRLFSIADRAMEILKSAFFECWCKTWTSKYFQAKHLCSQNGVKDFTNSPFKLEDQVFHIWRGNQMQKSRFHIGHRLWGASRFGTQNVRGFRDVSTHTRILTFGSFEVGTCIVKCSLCSDISNALRSFVQQLQRNYRNWCAFLVIDGHL